MNTEELCGILKLRRGSLNEKEKRGTPKAVLEIKNCVGIKSALNLRRHC